MTDGKPKLDDLLPGFNLDAMRWPQNCGEALGVRRVITHVLARKPSKTRFFRTRPGEAGGQGPLLVERVIPTTAGFIPLEADVNRVRPSSRNHLRTRRRIAERRLPCP